MRKAIPTAAVLVALLSCAILPALGECPGGRGTNEIGDDWAQLASSALSVSPLHIGDQNVSLSITLRNLRAGDADASNGDERMYNAILEVNGVEDPSGRLLPPSASPLVWNISRVDNNGNGYSLGRAGEYNSSYTFTGFRFDVKGIGADTGKYNISVKVRYEMMTAWSLVNGPTNETYTEDEDNIQFEVVSNIQVGAPVPYSEDRVPMRLYAGAGFQLLAVPVTTLSGPLDQLVATINVPTTSDLKLAPPAGTALAASLARLTGTALLYFRVDVPMAAPGAYDAFNANITLTVQYIRENNWNGTRAQISAGEEGHLLTFALEFTPLLNATGATPGSFTRGSTLNNLSVTLRNEGNADLARVKVSLDVSNYFTGGAYYYDGDGNRVPVPLEQTIPSLKRSDSWSAVFPMAVFSMLPAGTHRLPVRYSGYYEEEGGPGSSSGLYAMSDALYEQLRGHLPFVQVEVRDSAPRLSLTAALAPSTALNPDGESEGLVLAFEVRNDERVDFRDASFTLLSGNGTVLRNPVDSASRTLEPMRSASFPAGQTVMVRLVANLDRAAAAGFQQLAFRFNATSADSNAPVGLELRFTVRIGPFGPALSFSPGADLSAGGRTRGVAVLVTMTNSGGAVLSDLELKLKCGASTPLLNPTDRTQPYLEPRHLGSVGPLSSADLVFQADIDPNATATTYQFPVEVAGRYFATGERFTSTGALSLRVLPGPARLTVQGTSLNPAAPQAGKSFTLTIRVKNVGGDIARAAWVALGDLAGPGQLPGNGPSTPPQYGAGEAPFSAEVAEKYIGDLRPGDEVSVSFNMLAEGDGNGGRLFREPVLLGFDGPDGAAQYQTVPITIRLRDMPAPAAALAVDWTLLLLTLGFVVILGILIAVLLRPPAGHMRAPRAQATATPPEEAPRQPVEEIAVARPVSTPSPAAASTQPPPLPQNTEPGIPPAQTYPVQPGQLPPPPPPSMVQPPVAPPVADGGKLPEGYRPRPGPLEGYNIPGAEQEPRYAAPPQKPKAYSGREIPMRVCPSCGNEVKMRFVKCPICGADLPPVG